MGIPYRFDPMGTLGAAKDYIQDGLLLLVDATREPKGQLDLLMNFATGETIELPYAADNNDGLSFSSDFELPWSDFSTQYTAEVCCKIKDSSALVDIHPWENTGAKAGADTEVRLKGTSRLSGGGPGALSPTRWPISYYTNFVYSPLPPLGTVLSVYCQWGTVPIVNLVEQVKTNIEDGLSSKVGTVFRSWKGAAVLYSFRLYSRTLSTAEREHNYKIDKIKFMK